MNSKTCFKFGLQPYPLLRGNNKGACYLLSSAILLLIITVFSSTESLDSGQPEATSNITTSTSSPSSSSVPPSRPATSELALAASSTKDEQASSSSSSPMNLDVKDSPQTLKSLELLIRSNLNKEGEAHNETNTTTQQNNPLHTTKSLKFTLIAGKSWRFVIKGSSLPSYKGAELRLHKNVSSGNFIIDDEGWFQYNPQQQQLFAWPSLTQKSGTYYFVLLPSGVDIEADSENIVNPEVAASIVVELIKPLYQGIKAGQDIYQLIDYEFSLDYLHRHPTYPLLLNQIFSLFEALVKPNASATQQQLQVTTTTNSPGSSLLTTISPNQQVVGSGRPPNRLGEYLLLSSSYSQDGELFSVAWSTHPALLNNTITPISECRVNTITDTISKLSSLSAGFQSDENKFTLHYTLEAPQRNNTQAISPTERTNALKLTLNGPCQTAKILEELGIQQPQQQQQQMGKVANASSSADDIANNDADKFGTSTASITTTLNSTTNSTVVPGPEAIVTSTANQIISSETTPSNSSTLSSLQIGASDNSTVGPNQPRSISHQSGESDSPSVVSSSPSSVGTEPPVIKTSNTKLQQTKVQPQAKSFENFLEINDMQPPPISTSASPEVATTQQDRNLSSVTGVVGSTNINEKLGVVPAVTVTPAAAEPSFNEDFIGILDEVMNYLISVAVPASIIVGTILLVSIVFALCHLYRKRKKSKEFQVRSRFDFRYSSERKGFLKNSSRPVILEADQKSLSMGGTPQHKASANKNKQNKITDEERKHYVPMSTMYYEAAGGASGSAGIDGSLEANVQA